MTTTTPTLASSATTPHPLDRLTGEEFELNRAIIVDAGHVSEHTLFALVSLVEPAKHDVISNTAGLDRRVRSLLVERGSGEQTEILVSLTERKVLLARVLNVSVEGQAPITATEYADAEQMIRNDATWRAAVEARGITDIETVRICALSAGCFDIPGEEGRRLVRGSSFIQSDPQDNAWAHPLEGLVAYLDMNSGEVIEVVDTDIVPVPQERFDYHLDSWLPEARTTQKPIEITQPEGTSFTVDGDVLSWEKWQVRIGFDPVEGLVLHQIGFDDNGQHRPIVYRASVAEMVVPYGDPSPVRYWQNYYDAGEYSMGKNTNPLELGCDCVGEIYYSDAVLADEQGHAQTIKNAICIHEEDAGVLFKHTDEFTGAVDVRRNRRLVISFFITVGNYDYGFYWHLYLDGMIELECKATGIVYTAAYADESQRQRWSSPIGDEGMGMPFHQHMFCARLDMQVDGVDNAVDEQEAVRVPFGDDNPWGNGFTRKLTRLTQEGGRMANGEAGRVWHIVNPDKQNRHGFPVGYELHLPDEPTMMAAEGSSIAKRAGFGAKHLWLTRFDEDERFPSGTYPNQNPGNGTINQWVEQQRPVDGEDIVLWASFAMTHFPRPEDWPIMPVDRLGFTLKPYGFFDQNPTLDVPRPKPGHCATESRDDSCECG